MVAPALTPRAKNKLPRDGGPTFTLRHRVFRLFWTIVWNGVGRWTPTPLYAWRRVLLRIFGAHIHPNAKIYPGVRIWYPPNLRMDAFACLGPGVMCYNMAEIALGRHALVSQRAHLCGGSHDIDDPEFALQTAPIRIEASAWIAAEAFVGPGVTVREGAVLGARAVTVKSLQSWTVYAGNPARAVRARRRLPDDPS